MGVRIRYVDDGKTAKDTTFDENEKEGKIILSDWEFSESAKEHFGEDDIEWYYEFGFHDVPKSAAVLAEVCRRAEIADLDEKQLKYYESISCDENKELFLYAVSYMNDGSNGFSLSLLLESKGIEINRWSI